MPILCDLSQLACASGGVQKAATQWATVAWTASGRAGTADVCEDSATGIHPEAAASLHPGGRTTMDKPIIKFDRQDLGSTPVVAKPTEHDHEAGAVARSPARLSARKDTRRRRRALAEQHKWSKTVDVYHVRGTKEDLARLERRKVYYDVLRVLPGCPGHWKGERVRAEKLSGSSIAFLMAATDALESEGRGKAWMHTERWNRRRAKVLGPDGRKFRGARHGHWHGHGLPPVPRSTAEMLAFTKGPRSKNGLKSPMRSDGKRPKAGCRARGGRRGRNSHVRTGESTATDVPEMDSKCLNGDCLPAGSRVKVTGMPGELAYYHRYRRSCRRASRRRDRGRERAGMIALG